MAPKKKKVKQNKNSKSYATLKQHKQEGKSLIPPMLTVPNVKFANWMNDRLPELLWATLIVSHLERQRALELFREVAAWAQKFETVTVELDITHSGLARFDSTSLEEVLKLICSSSDVRAVLRPLLLLKELPAAENWRNALQSESEESDWNLLKVAIARTLNHQSDEATDCRWLRVIFEILAGKMKFPSHLEEVFKELFYYPDYGDIHAVHPTVRAAEGALGVLGQKVDTWAASFWNQCMVDTICERRDDKQISIPALGTTVEQVNKIHDLLIEHLDKTRTTTAVDAKHDATFGFAFYSLSILRELLVMGISTSILGRTGLRSLVECYLTLSYLMKKDDAHLWNTYRNYGSGQAKLAFLKLDDLEAKLSYVDVDTLEQLASEDTWQEYVPINLGHWEKSNLRVMSDAAGVKPEYDKYYSWTSGYLHGHWSSIRDSVFETCMNPLHRLHRIPRHRTRYLNDTIPDACYLTDKVLEIIDANYPSFLQRVTLIKNKD